MANNFSDAQVSLTNATLTDVFTATNKSLTIAGTISNTTTTSMNVSIKKYETQQLWVNSYSKMFHFLLVLL